MWPGSVLSDASSWIGKKNNSSSSLSKSNFEKGWLLLLIPVFIVYTHQRVYSNLINSMY